MLKPSKDCEGSEEDGASPTATPRPVASVRALGKKCLDPAPKIKCGPYTAHKVEQAMELAETIVAYCKNMGHTPESVLQKGGFNVTLSHQPSWWDIWQMYLCLQSYNPPTSTSAFLLATEVSLNFSGEGSWSAQASAMYNSLMDILSEDEMEEFQQEMLTELSQVKPVLDGQECKMVKTAVKQVQDLVSLGMFPSGTFFLDVRVYRQQLWDGPSWI